MSLLHRPLPSLLLVALLGAVSTAAMAGPPHGGRKPPPGGQQQSGQQQSGEQASAGQSNGHRRNDDAMSDSIRRVERATRGQVLSAERVQYEGRNLNRIKVVDERGRVRVYTDDPNQSGSGQPPGSSQPGHARSGQGAQSSTHGDDD